MTCPHCQQLGVCHACFLESKHRALRRGTVKHKLGVDPFERAEAELLQGRYVEFEFPEERDGSAD